MATGTVVLTPRAVQLLLPATARRDHRVCDNTIWSLLQRGLLPSVQAWFCAEMHAQCETDLIDSYACHTDARP